MVFCAQCGSEYRVAVKECPDCGSHDFTSEDELRKRGVVPRTELDDRNFVRAGTADDPLSAQRYAQTLREADIPVFSRPRRGGPVDFITTGVTHAWWEMLVPEEFLTRAVELLTEERTRIKAEEPEAERAAEEEERATEAAARSGTETTRNIP